MPIKYLLLLFALAAYTVAIGQQPAALKVTDSAPVIVSGLQMGYTILSAKEKEVGDKGNFSRYSIRFFVTNATSEAKLFLYKQGFTLFSGDGVSPYLARFDCLNATGARLTSKGATLEAYPCNLLANVEDSSGHGKTQINKRFVQVGYWIKAGQTVHTDAIVIVPLNTMPDMVVTPVFLTNTLYGNASIPEQPANSDGYGQPGFVKLKNYWKHTYLNNQNGPVDCTSIQDGWWSAQWQVIPVNGTNFYLLKNRWKDIYISAENPATMYSTNYKSRASQWVMEPGDGTAVRFKNVAFNNYLNIETGRLQSSFPPSGAWSAEWEIEILQ